MPLFKGSTRAFGELGQKEDRLLKQILSEFDTFTRLPNKTALAEFYESLGERKGDYAYVALCMESAGNIRHVLGYEVEERALMAAANLMRKRAGPGEFVCRSAPTLFGLLLQEPSEDALLARVESLIAELECQEVSDGQRTYAYPNRFTAGIRILSGGNVPFADMLEMAELAQKMAQHAKNECVLFGEQMLVEIKAHRALLSGAAEAMEKGQFVPYFHPSYDLKSGRIVNAEVLARWIHPEYGVLAPSAFIPILEQIKAMPRLDMIMVEQACKLVQKWVKSEMLPVPLSINISLSNVYNKYFVEEVAALAERYKIPPCLITLEMSERVVSQNLGFLETVATRLHDIGFRLCLDNFGNSNISLLISNGLPVDVVKLDKRFWQDETLERAIIVMRNMVRLAHELGITVIAAGVESRKHVEHLVRMNCNYGQGFLFCQPMPQDTFEKLTM